MFTVSSSSNLPSFCSSSSTAENKTARDTRVLLCTYRSVVMWTRMTKIRGNVRCWRPFSHPFRWLCTRVCMLSCSTQQPRFPFHCSETDGLPVYFMAVIQCCTVVYPQPSPPSRVKERPAHRSKSANGGDRGMHWKWWKNCSNSSGASSNPDTHSMFYVFGMSHSQQPTDLHCIQRSDSRILSVWLEWNIRDDCCLESLSKCREST